MYAWNVTGHDGSLCRAQQELVLVNQAYQDVLSNSETRKLYHKLCGFRPVRKRRHTTLYQYLMWI